MIVGDPCWRSHDGVAVLELPFRVVLPDGSTRTNPAEWSLDQAVLDATGWRADTLTAEDVAAMAPVVPQECPVWTAPAGWQLPLDDATVSRVAALHYLASRRAAKGLPATVTLAVATGASHTLTFAELDAIVVEYAAAAEAANGTAS